MSAAGSTAGLWRVLVVDDDPEVHAVTRLALADLEFEGRGLEIVAASSGAEARAAMQRHSDIALILLDVVMETEHAGLDFVHYVREALGNDAVRIVLRTGQPGQAPALDVIERYEIDDYRTKTELTFERLLVLVKTALRAYRLLRQLETRRRELERSNRELERFAYVASHDIQTPLRTIVSFAQLVQRRCADQIDARDRELLAFIEQGARELETLIASLLEYSRVGAAAAKPVPVDLGEVTNTACRRLRATIEERQAHVTIEALPVIPGSRFELERLFCNLIDNAIKFQPGAQPVVHISARNLGQEWEIRVADKGIGIEPQYLGYVFDAFRRLHPSDRFPGSGIGLAVCKRIAELHGGAIRAESQPGRGTTMVVTLPKTAVRPD